MNVLPSTYGNYSSASRSCHQSSALAIGERGARQAGGAATIKSSQRSGGGEFEAIRSFGSIIQLSLINLVNFSLAIVLCTATVEHG